MPYFQEKKQKMIELHSPELAKWYKTKIREKDASWRDFYISQIEKIRNKILRHTAKKYASCYLQLKVRHGAVETYLTKIRSIKIPQC